MRRRVFAAGLTAVVLAGTTACGSDSLSADPNKGAGVGDIAADPALFDKLPQKIKDAKKIVVGTDANYAPNEFTSDGTTIIGMDVDLFRAVGKKLGVEVDFQNAEFPTILAGVQGGKYDVGMSSFTINDERKKAVRMVQYYNAGTQWVTKAGNPTGFDPEHACGRTVALQTGTVQDTDDLPARQKECGANKINVLPFKGQDAATAALASGRVDATVADSPIAQYAVKQSNGQLATLGEVYDAAPYGWVVPKDEAEFADAISAAATELAKSGQYQGVLRQWGLESGAVTSFPVNP